MATKTKKRPRSTRTKTAHLPGMEPLRIKEIDDAADKYFEAKTERMELTKQEKETKAELKRVMKEHGQTHYVTPDDLECGVDEDVWCKRKKKDVSRNGEADE